MFTSLNEAKMSIWLHKLLYPSEHQTIHNYDKTVQQIYFNYLLLVFIETIRWLLSSIIRHKYKHPLSTFKEWLNRQIKLLELKLSTKEDDEMSLKEFRFAILIVITEECICLVNSSINLVDILHFNFNIVFWFILIV